MNWGEAKPQAAHVVFITIENSSIYHHLLNLCVFALERWKTLYTGVRVSE